MQSFPFPSFTPLISPPPPLMGTLNIRLVSQEFILLPWSVTLAALHGGARIMRVVGGRPTDRPDTPATPFTQPAEGETSIRRPYVLWIICFSKTTAGEIQLPLVMLPQFSLMLETAHQNNSGWKLEAVFFVCFLPQFPLFASRSAPAAPLLLVLHQKILIHF